MKNNKNNDELKDNNQKNVSSNVQINKKETGKISQAISIIFLPFDLNISNAGLPAYTRIRSKNSPGKRNKLEDIIYIEKTKNGSDENVEKVDVAVKNYEVVIKKFEDALNNDKFKLAEKIIDTSKYHDFIVNNFNYEKPKPEKVDNDSKEQPNDADLEFDRDNGNIGFIDWFEKGGNPNKYFVLPKSETEPKIEFEINKFGIIFNKQARSGSIMLELTWTKNANILKTLSEIDFFRYHDKDDATKIEEVKEIKKELSCIVLEELNPLIKVFRATDSNNNSVTLKGQIQTIASEFATIGFCYGKTSLPSISDIVVSNGLPNKNGYFNETIKNLEQNTTYYYRAYVIDKKGKTSYGSVHSFITASISYKNDKTDIYTLIETQYPTIRKLIFFNHVKPIVVHLINDSKVLGIDDEKLCELIYKTLRIPAKISDSVPNTTYRMNYREIVKLQSPDENISFATMNEGVFIIDNTVALTSLNNKYLPAFILALNQREFLLKVLRLVPSVDVNELEELKSLKKFITEIYLKQISFSVSVYNEIDLLFSELQKKFDIETLMKDNKESINEIHELIEYEEKKIEDKIVKDKEKEDKRKEEKLNIFITALTLIQALSIFYTLFNDRPEKCPYLFELFLSINLLIIIIGIILLIKFNYPTDKKIT